jgi:signal transduction histidine kinase
VPARRRCDGQELPEDGAAVGRFRRRLCRVPVLDGVVALIVGTFAVVASRVAAWGQVPPRRALDPVADLLIIAAASALAVRRMRPLVALSVAVGAIAAYEALRYPHGPILFVLGIAMFSVAQRAPIRRSLIAGLIAVVVVVVPELVNTHLVERLDDVSLLLVTRSGLVVLPWAVGVVTRVRSDAVRRVYYTEARQAVYEQRLRIGQEVHDVVGHRLAVINMRAGIALHVLTKRPEQAKEALEAIKAASKDALDDLRATLALFRWPPDDDQARRPPPGLPDLTELVAAIRDTGVPVELVVSGEQPRVPASVGLAAYRIVQESLTNVLRHAGPARATVAVDYQHDAIVLDVTDDGPGQPGADLHPDGRQQRHGIAGMRERAAAVGGMLTAGRRPEGGFRVHARLPI